MVFIIYINSILANCDNLLQLIMWLHLGIVLIMSKRKTSRVYSLTTMGDNEYSPKLIACNMTDLRHSNVWRNCLLPSCNLVRFAYIAKSVISVFQQ